MEFGTSSGMVAHSKQLHNAAVQPRRNSVANYMVDHNLIADIGIDVDQADALIRAAFGDEVASGNMDSVIIGDTQR